MNVTERSGTRTRRPQRAQSLMIAIALLALAACSSGNNSTSQPSGSTASPATQLRPSGPAAALTTELTGGHGVFLGEPANPHLAEAGYVQREYVASGTATSYKEGGPLARNGRWSFEPDTMAKYRTRVLVRAPAKPAAFSGTVVVEWLNVSGGLDANPEWVSLRDELVRAGDIWVGVSAQRIGVEGGPVLVKVDVPGSQYAGQGLKAIDLARYGSLVQPGDGYSYDIFTQVARAIRNGTGLQGLHPKRSIAAGESQSAFALVTYFNGVQPLTHAFDGFFVHSRGAGSLPLVGPGQNADIAGAIAGTPTTFRTDQHVPIMDIQTETDVGSILNSYAVRQPDTDHFRLWEVAGTAHADAHLLGSTAATINCGVPLNNGPMHIVAKAALRALTTWIETGTEPPIAPRIDVAPGTQPQIRRNSDGIALGGIRTPPVDVPVAALSGTPGPDPSTICLLLGSTKPLSAVRIAQLYPSRAVYLKRYVSDADRAINAGFVLSQDRATLIKYADPSRVKD